ncbi:hypothetical protein F4678DRAFT_482809 [Xylaria arbuscula]|nr:hypothetical protein F4678DRAFT_482809 [Xylaria arbuscula]
MEHNAGGNRGGYRGRGGGGYGGGGFVSNANTNRQTTNQENILTITGFWSDVKRMPFPPTAQVTVTIDTNQPGMATFQSTKRSFPDENSNDNAREPKKSKNEVKAEVIDPRVCGNCGAGNHRAAFCVKTGRSGWMETCPKCDSAEHMYEKCPRRNKGQEDFTYLIFNRQRKPPVKSTMVLGKVIRNELARPYTTFHGNQFLELPYSSSFARQEARQSSPGAYSYAHVGDPTREARNRVAQPNRTGISLSQAVHDIGIARQSWSREEEASGSERDRPIPSIETKQESPLVQPKREQSVSPVPRPPKYRHYSSLISQGTYKRLGDRLN